MLGIAGASHAEYNATAPTPNDVIIPVACALPDPTSGAPSLTGVLRVAVQRDTMAHAILGRDEIEEGFFCSYELNPDYQQTIAASGLRISGRGERGEARIVERPDRRFFIASLFLPQHSSTVEAPHPLVTAFVRAAAQAHDEMAASVREFVR